MDLYFNSFQKLKYLPEQTNKEKKASPNEIRSIQKSELYVAILKSLIYKDITTTVRKKIIIIIIMILYKFRKLNLKDN